jgi:hypothetical protein
MAAIRGGAALPHDQPQCQRAELSISYATYIETAFWHTT